MNFTLGLNGGRLDTRWQQTYQVNPSFLVMCACSELHKQWSLPGKPAATQHPKSLPLSAVPVAKGAPKGSLCVKACYMVSSRSCSR